MKSEKLWNGNYLRVMTANFCMAFAFYVLTPLLPLYLSEHFSAGKDMIGLVLSGYTLTALLVRPFSGFIVDSFPRKRVLLIALFFYFAFFGGYLLAGTLTLFAIVRTVHGAPFGASTVANSTVAIDVLPSSRRTEGIGYYGLSNNIATAIAPTIGVYIYTATHDFELLFWLAFAVAGLGLVADYFVTTKDRPIVRGKKVLSLDRFFFLKGWPISANLVFFGACYGILSNYLAIYGKERLGILSGTGSFFMLLSAGLIISRLTGARALRAGRLTGNATFGVFCSLAGYTMFVAWPSMTGYYLSAFLIGLGNGNMWPALQNMTINLAQNNERGTANSTILTCWDLGMSLGILAGGSAVEYFGYTTAFWSCAALQAIGTAVFLLATKAFYLRHYKPRCDI